MKYLTNMLSVVLKNCNREKCLLRNLAENIKNNEFPVPIFTVFFVIYEIIDHFLAMLINFIFYVPFLIQLKFYDSTYDELNILVIRYIYL